MASYVLNNELNGVELYFPTKPKQTFIDSLKAAKWRWNRAKNCWYTKQTPEAIEFAKTTANGNLQSTSEAIKPAKTVTNEHGVKIGDIFYTSWGYEQTNVDFFQVIAVTAKMATVRKISENRNETDWAQGKTLPDKDSFVGKESRRRTCNKYGGLRIINADGSHDAYFHDGEPVSWSAYY